MHNNIPPQGRHRQQHWLKDIRKLVYLCLLLLLYTALLHGQYTNTYEHFSVKDGLPSQSVYAVLQDRNGFLWISTDAGVSRFDGRHFVNYTTKDGLGDNEILDLYEDRKGRIWFKPFTGRLSYYYNDTIYGDHNDRVLAAITGRYINENILSEDAAGAIYIPVGAHPEIAMIRPDHTLRFLDLSDGPRSDTIQSVFSSNNKKHLYCRTIKGNLIDISTTSNAHIVRRSGMQQVFTGYSSSVVMQLNDLGLYTIDDTAFRLLIPAKYLRLDNSQTIHTDIIMDKHANIWICNSKNHTFFYPYTGGQYHAPVSVFEDMPVCLVSFDQENNIWAYDQRSGLYKIPYDRFFDRYTGRLNKLLLRKQVISSFADSRGNLWLGYSNGWISRISNAQAVHFDLNIDARRSNRIVQITEDKKGVLWVAADGSLSAIMPLPGGRYRIVKNKDIFTVKHVFTDTSGNAYCLKLSESNIIRLSTNHNSINTALYHTRGDFRSFSAFFNAGNILYSSEYSGLKRIENGQVKCLYLEDKRFASRIQHFAENKGVIFLATYSNGLIAMKQDKIIATIDLMKGVPGTICRRIYVRNDTLYVCTNAGISTLVFEQNTFRFLRNITVLDGLLSNDVYDLCFLDNTLYAGTSEGLSVLRLPLKSGVQAKPPVVSFLSFKANNKSYPAGRSIEMPYDQQHIRVTFVAPVMDKPELLSYRYRFVNKDQNWIITASNSIEYSNLPFGKYRLEVQARKYNSGWSRSSIITFTIHPPWYLTWWCLSTTTAVILILLYCLFSYIVRIRVRRSLREREVIEKERSRIAADIHDDIGADLTNMVMLSGMLKNKEKLPPNLMERIENSSHEIINKMNEIIWVLNTANDNMFGLVSYLNRYAENYLEASVLSYNITISEQAYTSKSITSEFRRNLFLVYKESLHNIVKHSDADSVDIGISLNGQLCLCIIIRDNGKGFDTDQQYSGNGLVNMKKRIAAISGSLEIQSQQGKGCSMVINLPYKK